MAGVKYKKQEIPPEYTNMLCFIGGILREYRWEEDLTRLEVQELSGIHRRTISRIENGENVSLITLFHYLNFLDLEMPDIAFTQDDIE